MSRIYADNSASTRLAPAALAAMMPFLTGGYGNPSSLHKEGIFCRQAIESARTQISRLLNGSGGSFVFTSGGTEANHLGLLGCKEHLRSRGNKILISATEHAAVKEPCKKLAAAGFTVQELPVDGRGTVQPEALAAAIDDRVALVAVMWANNEIGTVQPVRALADIAHEKGALFFCDAVAAVGHVPVDIGRSDTDFLTFSGRKCYGPQGIGALFVKHGVSVSPVLTGGSQENSLRAGTENTAGIVGLAAALQDTLDQLDADARRLNRLSGILQQALAGTEGVILTGDPERRVPGLFSCGIRGADGEAVAELMSLKDICISAGAACKSGSVILSDTVRAIGIRTSDNIGHIRVSFGRYNTESDAELLGKALADVIARLRALSAPRS